MSKKEINVWTKYHNYDLPKYGSKGNEASTFEFPSHIHIKKLIVDVMPCIPKGVLKSSMHNPNSCVS